MNAPVIRELERQRAADCVAREQALATEVHRALSYVPLPIDQTTLERARPFLAYCAGQGVSYLPARCETVAAFLLSRLDMPPTLDSVCDTLDAITAAHDAYSLPSPVKSPVVEAALERWPQIRAPQSWRATDKLLFASLPRGVQHVVARRETERDREVRRLQSRMAEISTPKGCDMAQNDRGLGHFTKNTPIRENPNGPKEDKGRSIADETYREGTAGSPLPRR